MEGHAILFLIYDNNWRLILQGVAQHRFEFEN